MPPAANAAAFRLENRRAWARAEVTNAVAAAAEEEDYGNDNKENVNPNVPADTMVLRRQSPVTAPAATPRRALMLR
jgi:hypothetical protein